MKINEISGKAQKETRRKSKAGEFLTDQESEVIARYSHQTLCCKLARPPKSAHLLTPLALTHDILFVSDKITNDISSKAQKEARSKSKAGEFLTDKEAHYIARYSHASSAIPSIHIC